MIETLLVILAVAAAAALLAWRTWRHAAGKGHPCSNASADCTACTRHRRHPPPQA